MSFLFLSLSFVFDKTKWKFINFAQFFKEQAFDFLHCLSSILLIYIFIFLYFLLFLLDG